MYSKVSRIVSLSQFNTCSTNNIKDELNILFAIINITFDVVMHSETWRSEINYPDVLNGYDNFFVNWSRSHGVSLRKSNLQRCLVDNYTIVTDYCDVVTVQTTENLFLCYVPPSGCRWMFFLLIFPRFAWLRRYEQVETISELWSECRHECRFTKAENLRPLWKQMGCSTLCDHTHEFLVNRQLC